MINNSTSSSAGRPFPSLFRAPGNHLIDGEAAWAYLDRGVPLRGEHNGIERSSQSIKYHRYKYELTKAGDRSWIRIDKSRRGVGPPQRRIDHFRNSVVYMGRTCIIGPDKLHFARFYYNLFFLFIYDLYLNSENVEMENGVCFVSRMMKFKHVRCIDICADSIKLVVPLRWCNWKFGITVLYYLKIVLMGLLHC